MLSNSIERERYHEKHIPVGDKKGTLLKIEENKHVEVGNELAGLSRLNSQYHHL